VTPSTTVRLFAAGRARPAGQLVDGAIVHSMAELVRAGGVDIPAWEFLEQEELSVQALIHPDGAITEGAGVDRVCYHAGTSVYQGRAGLNTTFLGAEFLVAGAHNYDDFLHAIARPGCYTDAQYNAGGFLYASWMKRYPKLTLNRILGHSEVSGDDVRGPGQGKRDPGLAFDWPRFRQSVLDWQVRLRSAA
jgi:AmpD protein